MRSRDLRRLASREQGAQIVEFAFLLPIFLLLVFGIIDFGRAYFSWIIITNGAREGARAAAVGVPASTVAGKVQGAVSGLYVTSFSCSTTMGALCITTDNIGGDPGAPVTVSVSYNFSFLVLPNIMALAGNPGLPGGVFPLRASSTMRLE